MSKITYGAYLKLYRVLTLLRAGEASSPEVLFKAVHLAIEMLLSYVISSLQEARDQLMNEGGSLSRALQRWSAANSILESIVEQTESLKALGPSEFLDFRHKFGGSASGAQSVQMRHVELLLGIDVEQRARLLARFASHPAFAQNEALLDHLRDPLAAIGKQAEQRLSHGASVDPEADTWDVTYIEAARHDYDARGTLFDAFEHSLGRLRLPLLEEPDRTDIDNEAAAMRFVSVYIDALAARAPDRSAAERERTGAAAFFAAEDAPANVRVLKARVRRALLFIESYPDLASLALYHEMIERAISSNLLLLRWRESHASVVQRIMGRRAGTASPGLLYLEMSRQLQIFEDIVTIRTLLLPSAARPTLAEIETLVLGRDSCIVERTVGVAVCESSASRAGPASSQKPW